MHLDRESLAYIATSFFAVAVRTADIPAGAVDVALRLPTPTNSKTPAGMPALQTNAANVSSFRIALHLATCGAG
jgi:hypothetical protein